LEVGKFWQHCTTSAFIGSGHDGLYCVYISIWKQIPLVVSGPLLSLAEHNSGGVSTQL